ncbi:hypothetical protein EB796_021950 [Bugula neritina]|uniref:Uncharacterized protein n=1 Tax=Bugula neritina TaxID=10212 RepID=A0A7J7J0L1_BUGNE|nr:hypothetical protein EB796_021950 [Bugula neritina]
MQDPLANNTNDIVLPPPPQFQENTTPLAAQYPSYGDYEVLSPDASYQFNGHPLTPPSYVPYNQYNYHQKIAVDQLGNSLNEKLMFSKEHNSSSTNNNTGLTYSPLVSHNINGFPTQSWHYDSKSPGRGHTVSHHHQYSTEL